MAVPLLNFTPQRRSKGNGYVVANQKRMCRDSKLIFRWFIMQFPNDIQTGAEESIKTSVPLIDREWWCGFVVDNVLCSRLPWFLWISRMANLRVQINCPSKSGRSDSQESYPPCFYYLWKAMNKYLLLKVTVIDGRWSIWKVVHFLLARVLSDAKSTTMDGAMIVMREI